MSGFTTGVQWSEYDDIFLQDNWGKMPASKIGEALGRSKNSVLGRAHRMGLAHLISPSFARLKPVNPEKRATQKREYERRRNAAQKAGVPFTKQEKNAAGATLPGLETLRAIANEPFKHEVEPMPKRPVNPAPPPLRRQPLPPQVPRSASIVLGVLSQCCWPIGEPGTRDFKFCCEPVEAVGKSYCPDHMKIAYVTRQRERVW